jgi:hypothetical protein
MLIWRNMMTKFEKAKEIIRQGGNCTGIYCEFSLKEECPCSEICKKDIGVIPCPTSAEKKKRIEICEKYLKDNVVEKQIFDKSKVLVAGIHDIEAGKRYYVSNDIDIDSDYCLRRYVENKNEERIQTLECYREGKYRTSDGYYAFAYPCEEPVKTWRPIKTIEEARTLRGKWLISKTGKIEFLVTRIAFFDAGIYINDSIRSDFIFDQYTMEDGSPVGIEE